MTEQACRFEKDRYGVHERCVVHPGVPPKANICNLGLADLREELEAAKEDAYGERQLRAKAIATCETIAEQRDKVNSQLAALRVLVVERTEQLATIIEERDKLEGEKATLRATVEEQGRVIAGVVSLWTEFLSCTKGCGVKDEKISLCKSHSHQLSDVDKECRKALSPTPTEAKEA